MLKDFFQIINKSYQWSFLEVVLWKQQKSGPLVDFS